MSCLERTAWPRRKAEAAGRPPPPPAGAPSAFAVLLRTSGLTTHNLTPCTRAYFELLRRELDGTATLHLLTDLSLWAPPLSFGELRAHADAHEARLRRELPGVEPFAFTVADLVTAWPAVRWPLPGDAASARCGLDNGMRMWLRYVHRTLGTKGS